MTDNSAYLGHFDEIGQFLVRDAATHMPPGGVADRAQQIADIVPIKNFLSGRFNAKADPYENLKDRFAIAVRLDEVAQLMNKDAELFVAEADKPRRQELVTTIGTVMNMMIADPAVSQWLDAAEADSAGMGAEDRRNLALMRRKWVHEASLTPQMAGDVAQMAAKGEELHTNFRKDGDWSKIKDWYGKAFDLMRSVGAAKKARLGVSTIYEALMDTFSPGLRDATVAAEFGKLERDLPALIGQVVEKQKQEPAVLPLPKTTMAQQEELSRRVAKAMCFDFDKGRMDMCDGHPSCATVSD
jgi:carboxypeptidase Taq